MAAQVEVPAADFATRAFWRRATSTAAGEGHDGHPVQLTGYTEPTDVYELRCVQCGVQVVAIRV
ncbi:hypothetical protein [Micromonospora carbonacea]|uniref:Uncharacterized protein n=1 Tax=Micromonospora carbonacea TaxID=47853 RepID=A0A1C5A9R3_9ACTN|nr:hypothetical protein [Micromonospora carbonacea]SCF41950.1 hypothetical protein GA0070563_11219 [Micromonospora carbonacea]